MPAPSSMGPQAIPSVNGIAALCVLQGNADKVVLPRPPRNVPSASHQRTQGYETLSFLEEVRLARNMAFLAYLRDDPNCIPAVCIEQSTMVANIGALCVRVATNTGTKMLEEAVSGLQGICTLMARKSSSSASHDDILLAIVEMCSPRILTRLGLCARKQTLGAKQKQTFSEALHGAILSLTSMSRPANLRPSLAAEIALLVSCTEEIDKRVSDWGRYATCASLAAVVTAIHNLNTTVDVEALLATVSQDVLDKAGKASISNKITKISRYLEIARYFERRASKDAVFRSIQVLPVILPDSILSTNALIPDTAAPPHIITFAHVLEHAIPPKDGGKIEAVEVSQLLALLKQTPRGAQQSFQDRLAKLQSSANKVHAEVKLLSFYELLQHENLPRSISMPRAVCSSKDACWLCDALITAHGAMFTPRCHGVLYPSWRLPTLLASASSSPTSAIALPGVCALPAIPPTTKVSVRLAARLQEQVMHSVRTMLSLQRRPSYPPPLESTLSMLRCSLSTVNLPLVSALEAQHGQNLPVHDCCSMIGASALAQSPITYNDADEVSSAGFSQSEDSCIHGDVLPVNAENSPVLLRPGRPINYRLATTSKPGSLWLRARGVDLFLAPAASDICERTPGHSFLMTTYTIELTEHPPQSDAGRPRVQRGTSDRLVVGKQMPVGVENCLQEDEHGYIHFKLSNGSSVHIRRHRTVMEACSDHLVSNL